MAEQRSKPYPAYPIGDALTKLRGIYKRLGDSKAYSSDNFAQGLGYKDSKNGAFLRTAAGLTQYGLAVKDGNYYKLTELSKKILIPTTDNSVDEGAREAALSPQLFAQLYDRYKGQELPGLLPNILVTDFGILDGAKNKAAAVFRLSMEYVNLLKGNLLLDIESAEEAGAELGAAVETQPYSSASADLSFDTVIPTTALVKDFGEGRVARLAIPNDLSTDEREKLANLIRSM